MPYVVGHFVRYGSSLADFGSNLVVGQLLVEVGQVGPGLPEIAQIRPKVGQVCPGMRSDTDGARVGLRACAGAKALRAALALAAAGAVGSPGRRRRLPQHLCGCASRLCVRLINLVRGTCRGACLMNFVRARRVQGGGCSGSPHGCAKGRAAASNFPHDVVFRRPPASSFERPGWTQTVGCAMRVVKKFQT